VVNERNVSMDGTGRIIGYSKGNIKLPGVITVSVPVSSS
jgi:hypothetical protein